MERQVLKMSGEAPHTLEEETQTARPAFRVYSRCSRSSFQRG